MKFTVNEKLSIDQAVKIEKEKEIKNIVPSEVYEYLKKSDNIKTVTDSIHFYPTNFFRPYDSYRITHLLEPDFDAATFLKNLLIELSPGYLVFIDFHFIIEKAPESISNSQIDTIDKPIFKFQNGTKASALNKTIKIFTENDFDSLLEQFKGKTHADLLNDAFINHSELFEYENSGLRPYILLSTVIHLQRWPS